MRGTGPLVARIAAATEGRLRQQGAVLLGVVATVDDIKRQKLTTLTL